MGKIGKNIPWGSKGASRGRAGNCVREKAGDFARPAQESNFSTRPAGLVYIHTRKHPLTKLKYLSQRAVLKL